MTEQSPSAEALKLAKTYGIFLDSTKLAREIDALCEQRVSAETKRCAIMAEAVGCKGLAYKMLRAPAERPAPPQQTQLSEACLRGGCQLGPTSGHAERPEGGDALLREIALAAASVPLADQPTVQEATEWLRIYVNDNWHWGPSTDCRRTMLRVILAVLQQHERAMAALTAPAVVDYTERARVFYNDKVLPWERDYSRESAVQHQMRFEAMMSDVLSAVASEHQAALMEARQAWMAIEAHRNQLLTQHRRLMDALSRIANGILRADLDLASVIDIALESDATLEE